MTEPYATIPISILEDPNLTPNDKMVYLTIHSFMNRKNKACYPSLMTIIKRSGLNKRTVLKGRRNLQKLGLLTWFNQPGFKRSAHYCFENSTDGVKIPQPLVQKYTNFQVIQGGAKIPHKPSFNQRKEPASSPIIEDKRQEKTIFNPNAPMHIGKIIAQLAL
ncbi:hypothetical protein ES702_07194 [subsurface metagenome]